MKKRRNAQFLAAVQRKAGAHSGKKKPQPSLMSVLEEYYREIEEESMSEIQAGDEVRVVNPSAAGFNEVGNVVFIDMQAPYPVRVTFPWDPDSRPYHYKFIELEKEDRG